MEIQLLVIIIIMIACSAFFSASETALTGANRIRLKSMAENGSKGAKMALKLLDRYDKVITTILIGNNIVNITASSLGTILATAIVGPDNAALVSTVVLTLVILAFGEVMPKSLAKDHSERADSRNERNNHIPYIHIHSLSALFILLKKLANKLFGNKKEVTVTEQELMAIIDEIEDEGVLEEQERDLRSLLLRFDETVVDEIITHRGRRHLRSM
ncbi:MAG: CNNM domain-containing protein [[Eubacterium] siraeum]